MNPLYPFVARRARYRCEYCHAPQSAFNFTFEVEHIHPQSQGGTREPENTALACHSCNIFKSAQLTAVDSETGTQSRFFHPRRDVWDEHFVVNLETVTIQGQTPIGRVTVERFQMNSDIQRIARRLWIQLEIFP